MGMYVSAQKRINRLGLLIGINYIGSNCELNGCINDTENLHKMLLEKKYFNENELVFMNDNKEGDCYPSKVNMMLQLNKMVTYANKNPNDRIYLFFSYSGHGSQVRDVHGDEKDGYDEVLCPVDCDSNGFIVDDELRENFVDKLGPNVTLVVLIDACHSGTMLDLRYLYRCDTTDGFTIENGKNTTKCNVIMISGCRDNQTSADAYVETPKTRVKDYQGAMTTAFLNTYVDGITTIELIKKMREWLIKNNFDQVPQLSSGKLIDLHKQFLLSVYDL